MSALNFVRRNFTLFLSLASLFFLAACAANTATVTTNVATANSAQSASSATTDGGPNILNVSSNISQEGTTLVLFQDTDHDEFEAQFIISAQMAKFVNSGKYNITQCQTDYDSGYLAFGRCNYLPGSGKGNDLRVTFLQSKQGYDTKKNTEIVDLLHTAGNKYYSKVTINDAQYLVSAELWYFTK